MQPTKKPFAITAPPDSDIWRKPPSRDVFNAKTSLLPPIPLTSFSRSRISLASSWKYRYDQGGLLLHLTKPGETDRWLKAGVEFYNQKPYISAAGCDKFADWSIYPVDAGEEEFTLELRREGDENGKGLWVYWLKGGGDGERVPVREVAWFFASEEGWDVSVGAYACRPAGEDVVKDKEKLEVRFWGFEMEELQ
ncbi:hypothetical protein FGG08_007049 [Glutinoglossum americanum]|uniref:Uncharacterized protein n=1 Tax=Glutinoglossum americanum TaxID=1670608 RepID=A0A9P8L1B5_9PEZI|nr:hypothetical protein FGG08_007049 [Glutinoglossum americanum]